MQQAVAGGDVVVIDKDLHLAYSDQIGQGKHGDGTPRRRRAAGSRAEAGDSGDAKSHGTGS